MLRYISCLRWHLRGLSSHVLINFGSSLALDGFGQQKLSYISCQCWNRRVVTNEETFYAFVVKSSFWSTQDKLLVFVLLVMGRVSSTQVEINMFPPCHISSLVNVCRDTYCFLAGRLRCIFFLAWGGACFEIPLVPSLA